MMRTFVIGGDGGLGAALCTRLLEEGHFVLKTTRRDITGHEYLRPREQLTYFDLTKPDLPARNVLQGHYERGLVVYIMAAITGIMRAETDALAWHVNAEAPVLIARQAHERGWPVVFISSGTVERAQHTALARQKAYADLAVIMLGGCVVRPLPFVPPERFHEIADLLMRIGEEGRTGVVRWEG